MPDQLVHHAETAVDADRALRGGVLADDQPEQRRLADTVRADQGDSVTVADVERDVAKSSSPPGRFHATWLTAIDPTRADYEPNAQPVASPVVNTAPA